MIEALGVAVIGLLGVIWAYIKGRSEGKEQQQGEQAKKVVKDVKQAKEVVESVRDVSADERRERLRQHVKR